ncbi:DUF1212-domain-containing protein [Panus rudis PR-1116 ss-1]|nr:DUF1212-domain-containing protein [Panus rudis PR-1116 ss-1]
MSTSHPSQFYPRTDESCPVPDNNSRTPPPLPCFPANSNDSRDSEREDVTKNDEHVTNQGAAIPDVSFGDSSSLIQKSLSGRSPLSRPSYSRRFSAAEVEPQVCGASGLSYKERVKRVREKNSGRPFNDPEDFRRREEFILTFAKVLLSFGAPSHRVESQLESAAAMLQLDVGFVHLPNLIIVSFLDSPTHLYKTKFVRASGRISLTALHKIHLLYRDVLRGKLPIQTASAKLRAILRARPIYPTWMRCIFAFICASIICSTAFGGAVVDMFVSGASASTLQFLGLRAALRSTIYANVYEISVSIIVSFLARALGTLRANIFCFSAISSAGVVLVLPGFTVLTSALELTSQNIVCGSVRMVYAIIYTLFLGFGLLIGSELYLAINPNAHKNMALIAMEESQIIHGSLIALEPPPHIQDVPWTGRYSFLDVGGPNSRIVKGCYRNPAWPWYRQPLPWWTLFLLVPIYSTFSSLSNLQYWRSIQLPIMVIFSCLAYAANRGANHALSGRNDIVSAFGALVIGICGNVYSRIVGGTAFTSMVTGVLFLVPSAIGNSGGLLSTTNTSTQAYSAGFSLGVRMIQVAIGVTVGLFIAQIAVYALGRRKNAAFFAF